MTEPKSEDPTKRAVKPRFSVITVVKNDADGLVITGKSVREQQNVPVEWVVIDGSSLDSPLEAIVDFKPNVWVSEPDEGIYDAMQKGVSLCSGDIVYFLNAGDSLHDPHVLSEVSAFFEQWNCDAAFATLCPHD